MSKSKKNTDLGVSINDIPVSQRLRTEPLEQIGKSKEKVPQVKPRPAPANLKTLSKHERLCYEHNMHRLPDYELMSGMAKPSSIAPYREMDLIAFAILDLKNNEVLYEDEDNDWMFCPASRPFGAPAYYMASLLTYKEAVEKLSDGTITDAHRRQLQIIRLDIHYKSEPVDHDTKVAEASILKKIEEGRKLTPAEMDILKQALEAK